MQYGFYFNADVCTGCRSCAAACKDINNLPLGKKFRRVLDYSGGGWTVTNGVCQKTDFFAYSLSTACNHCAHPLCVENCPSGAMTKDADTGIVWCNHDVCIGCGMCTLACPYGQPWIDPDEHVSRKCEFCRQLLAAGEDPACVAACTTRALLFGDITNLQERFGTTSSIPPLPESTTMPSLVFTPSRLNPDGTLPGRVTNPEDELL